MSEIDSYDKLEDEYLELKRKNKKLKEKLAAKEAELATCQRLYSEQRDRKNLIAEELSELSNDRNEWFDKAMELSRELAQERKHSGKCVECGAWTCGYCGISDSEGKWHCKTCQT